MLVFGSSGHSTALLAPSAFLGVKSTSAGELSTCAWVEGWKRHSCSTSLKFYAKKQNESASLLSDVGVAKTSKKRSPESAVESDSSDGRRKKTVEIEVGSTKTPKDLPGDRGLRETTRESKSLVLKLSTSDGSIADKHGRKAEDRERHNSRKMAVEPSTLNGNGKKPKDSSVDRVVKETTRKPKSSAAELSGKNKDEDGKEKQSVEPANQDSASQVYVPRPSRGELYLEEQRRKDEIVAQKLMKKPEKKKDKSQVKLKSLDPCCYGCGAVIQCSLENTPGYIDEETFMLKKKHHQLKTVLCSRCQLMCHGKIIPAVGGYGAYGREKAFVTAEELRAQLAHIREEKVLVLKLVDIVDFSGSFITRVRDLVGANPIVLVATKIDLLPEETNLAAVGDWIIESTLRKKLNVISVHLTSAKSFMGINNIVKEIHRERQGRDVYILGAANVGKSAFISALLKEMAPRDPVAAAAKRFKPVQSVLPGTTVGPISIDAFSSGGSLFDTPGVHLHHRIETAVSPDDLPQLFPARRLRGYIVSSILERKGGDSIFTAALRQAENSKQGGCVQSLTGMSLFWAGIARVDVLKAPQNTRLTFYGSSSLRVHKVSTSEAEDFYAKELGKRLAPPTGAEKASVWPGLEHRRQFSLSYDESRPAGDIAISGLGWMSVEFIQVEGGADAPQAEEEEQCLEVEVHVPKGIEVFLRPSIPVGGSGAKWYTFAELSEEQEGSRPRLYYSDYKG